MAKYRSDVANALHKIAVSQPGGLEVHNIVDAIHSANDDGAVLEEIGEEIMSRITSQQELRAAQRNIPELQQIPALRDPDIYEQQLTQKYVEKWGESPVMTPPDPHRRRYEVDKQIDGLQQRMNAGLERDPETYFRKLDELMVKRDKAIAADRSEVDEFQARLDEMQADAANAGIGPVHASRAAHARKVQRLVDAGVVTDGSLFTDDAALADPTDLVGASARLRAHEEANLDPVSKEMRKQTNKDDLRRVLRNTPGIVIEGEGGHEGGQGAH